MIGIDINQSLAEIVAGNSLRAQVLEKYGVDYWCQGDRSLRAACEQRGYLDTFAVLKELQNCDQVMPPYAEHPTLEWQTCTLTKLIEHISCVHHKSIKDSFPHLLQLADLAIEQTKFRKVELTDLRNVFLAFKDDLITHMDSEEKMLFPLIERIEKTNTLPALARCRPIAEPCWMIMVQHASATKSLQLMRKLANDYIVPEDASQSHQMLWKGLSKLETELHMLIHEENNILLPRTIALEERLKS
jgi:regulator of cell morphogenesis and NO signaling